MNKKEKKLRASSGWKFWKKVKPKPKQPPRDLSVEFSEKEIKHAKNLERKIKELEKQIKNLESWIPTLTITTEDMSGMRTITVTFTEQQLESMGRDQFLMNLVRQLDAQLEPETQLPSINL